MSLRGRLAGGHRGVAVALSMLLLLPAGWIGMSIARYGLHDGLSMAFTGRPSPAEGRCDGVTFDDVRGDRPAYVDDGDHLSGFVNDESMCRGLWLPRADDWFVPQGVALDGRTAWVSGFRWRARFGNRPCQLLHVDLRTGEELAFQARLEGQVADGPAGIWCHHGGGLMLTPHGLWVAETGRVWLVDPARVGGEDAVLRVWRLDDEVSGGFLVSGRPGRFALGDFHLERDSTMHWYRISDVLAAGVTALAGPRAEGLRPSQARAVRSEVAPRYAQGGSVHPRSGAAYLTESLSTCGVLRTPGGRRLAFAPGAEGVAFDDQGGMWAALESGARGYQEQDRPLTPMLARFDLGQLRAGADEACPW